MTRRVGEVIQVVGRARAGDPVTATAVVLHARLADSGSPGRLTAADPGTMGTIERYDPSMDGHVLVHSVDGGEGLGAVVGHLTGHALTLVHHGSAAGSDRRALRALRASTGRAVGVDPIAREELRGLGFRNVGILDGISADDPFRDVVAHQPTVDNLAQHPGPLLLCVGPIGPHRGVEMLLEAFAEVLTHVQPSAVLSVCGPSSHWYLTRLHRSIAARGLVACEIVEPTDDGQVLARLDRADVVISLRPAALDPYLRVAARRGLPVVAPVSAASAGIDPATFVPVPDRCATNELSAALANALARPHGSPGPVPTTGDGVLAALGLT